MGSLPQNVKLDPPIVPLVEAINGWEEFETVASCGGHRLRKSRPYVYFLFEAVWKGNLSIPAARRKLGLA